MKEERRGAEPELQSNGSVFNERLGKRNIWWQRGSLCRVSVTAERLVLNLALIATCGGTISHYGDRTSGFYGCLGNWNSRGGKKRSKALVRKGSIFKLNDWRIDIGILSLGTLCCPPLICQRDMLGELASLGTGAMVSSKLHVSWCK